VLVEQLLLNLIENAAKYTPKDGPLEIAAFETEGGVAVEVRDRGPGIPDEMKESIFEKFVRGRVPGQPGGTGLGLAIARGIALAPGGPRGAGAGPPRGGGAPGGRGGRGAGGRGGGGGGGGPAPPPGGGGPAPPWSARRRCRRERTRRAPRPRGGGRAADAPLP